MVTKHVLSRGSIEPPEATSPAQACVYAEACPSRAILELIADKWTLLILPALRRGPLRNGDLMRLIGGVSQKMLTQTLRELERNGLVNRIDHQEVPPRVEYELTELGRSLSDLMRKLDGWAEANLAAVLEARAAFESREKSGNGP
jgi:DNA-binding HxlR family transcriptional regulator